MRAIAHIVLDLSPILGVAPPLRSGLGVCLPACRGPEGSEPTSRNSHRAPLPADSMQWVMCPKDHRIMKQTRLMTAVAGLAIAAVAAFIVVAGAASQAGSPV